MWKFFCCSSIKTYSSFSVIFWLSYPLFWLWAIFRGDAQWRGKNLLGFQMQNFILYLLGKKPLFQKLARPWNSVMPNLKYLNKSGVQWRTLWKDLKLTNVLHFICLLIITCNPHARFQKKKCLPEKLLLVRNWGKMTHCPNQQQQGFIRKFHIYHFGL